MRWLEDEQIERGTDNGHKPRPASPAGANDEPRGRGAHRLQHERAPLFQADDTSGVECANTPTQRSEPPAQVPALCGEHRVSHGTMLPRGFDSVRIANVDAEQPLEPVVAVEARAVL